MPATTERIIKELWVWVGTDHLGNEGVICRDNVNLAVEPFVADTRDRLEKSARDARAIAEHFRLDLKAARFVR